MSELTYKKIVDVETVETLNDAATVFINDNGAMKQVAADKFGAVKSIDGITPDETGNIEYGRSNPIPFNKAGNTIKCTMPFAEAIAIASSGTNQANVTLALSTFDANTSLLIAETKYASSVTVGIKAGAGEKLWLQADFDMDDGSVIRLQLNPDESVTETIIKPEENAGGSGGAFVVNLTLQEGESMYYYADKTMEETFAAHKAGQRIIFRRVIEWSETNKAAIELIANDFETVNGAPVFIRATHIEFGPNGVTFVTLAFSENGEATISTVNYPYPEQVS